MRQIPDLIITKINNLKNKKSSKIYLGNFSYTFNKVLDQNIKISHSNNDIISKEKNFLYIKKLKRRILPVLKDHLNYIHQTKYNADFWNIYLGTWLENFLHVIYDRWIYTDKIKREENFNTQNLKFDKNILIPNETIDSKLLWENELWNHNLLLSIIQYRFEKKIKKLFSRKIKKNIIIKIKKSRAERLFKKKNFILFILAKLFKPKKKNKLIFLDNFNYKFQLSTFFKIFKIPIFISLVPILDRKLDLNIRNKKLSFNYHGEFEKFLSKTIPKNLPLSSIENFKKHINHKFNISYTSKNYVVSNFWALNDLYKIHLALNKNSNKIFLQHGGVYGQIKYNISELNEIEISDYFLTWGWSKSLKSKYTQKKDSKKIIDFYSTLIKNKKYEPEKNNNKILIILDNIPEFNTENSSKYNSITYKNYLHDIIKFIKNLKQSLKSKIIVRLYFQDYEKNIYNILKNKFPQILFQSSDKNIYEAFDESKLCIIGNNSTSFLEAYSNNVPTILFWTPKTFLPRENVKKILKEAKKLKLFFDKPEKLAHFLNNDKNDFEKVWKSSLSKNFRKKIIYKFANLDKTKIKKLINILK